MSFTCYACGKERDEDDRVGDTDECIFCWTNRTNS